MEKVICAICQGGGISYGDKSKPVGHPYEYDHMNAHLCESCGGVGYKKGNKNAGNHSSSRK